MESTKQNMTLVSAIRLEYLEQCAADVMAANEAVNMTQAARSFQHAYYNADQAIEHTSNKRRRVA